MGFFDKLRKPKEEGITKCISGEERYLETKESFAKNIIDTRCPYCSAPLDTAPARKKKCPSCGQFIYVRTRPSDNQRILVTEEDAKSLDALKNLGVSQKEYQDIEKQLSQKFRTAPSQGDIVWTILNERLISAMKKNDWQQMGMLYWSQARLLYELGKEFFRPGQEAARCVLRNYQSMGVRKVEILTAGDSYCCEKCRALKGKVFTVKKALETMPIPVMDCEKGLCRCIYLSVVD
jgi:DNA-directed RNA polymerase subunit RPC12/RpoP